MTAGLPVSSRALSESVAEWVKAVEAAATLDAADRTTMAGLSSVLTSADYITASVTEQLWAGQHLVLANMRRRRAIVREFAREVRQATWPERTVPHLAVVAPHRAFAAGTEVI